MGKSDPYIFRFYASQLKSLEYDSVGFFGQKEENMFSMIIRAKTRFFYDLSLNNWDINSFPYDIENQFDLIVCTRCAYFSKDPKKMLREFELMLKPGGKILIDWGYGDHWRFKDYKVGWIKNNEQEWAYKENNYLWSGYTSDAMFLNDEYLKFQNSCKKFNYKNIRDAIFGEVPVILRKEDVVDLNLVIKSENYMFLWPALPQLYVCLLLEKK